MILIKNRQKKIKVNPKRLHIKVKKILEFLGYQDFDLGILLTTNRTIRKLNRKFRGKDKPTDILSFPYHPNLKKGEKIKVKTPEDKNLGDIVISLEYAQKNFHDYRQTKDFQNYLITLLAHGLAHLLGYDHKTDQHLKEMLKIEKNLLKKTGCI